MKRAGLALGAVLLGAGLCLVLASWLLLIGLQWHQPRRFATLPFGPLLWTEALPVAKADPVILTWVAVSGVIGGLVFLMLMAGILRMTFKREDQALHGETRFATQADGERVGLSFTKHPRPDTIILGRTKGWRPSYVGLPGTEHVLLAAKTRSGKGVSFVLPNCLSWSESLVVLDVKRENWEASAGHRARMGQKVFLFEPLAESGHTHCWNPLGGIDAFQPDYISKLQRRAFDLFPEVSGRERFWQDGARSAFLGIAVLIAETSEMTLNPANVFRWFARGDASAELARMIDARRTSARPYSQACVDLVADYLSGTEEVVKGVRKHVAVTMGLWFNPKIAAATARSDFDLHQLRRERMSVYVAVMPADLGQLGVLLKLFFTQLFEANTDALPDGRTIRYKCHVLLDEFTSIPAMRNLARAAGFAAGFGLRFSFVVQSKNQVREEYRGNGEASLLENIGAEIIFGTNDPQLCKEASERAGYDTVQSTSETKPRWWAGFRWSRQNRTESPQRRALLLPQEVARMPSDEELVFRSSVPAFKLGKLRWFEDPNFAKLRRRPPAVPVVTYQLARDDGTVKIPVPDTGKVRMKKAS